ncbi:hypothetical protein NSA47_05670 [Irregularibacter muris]|uniref:Uncharacterized protein n=1 Tax=Irregularibacter muris TaxID=1796619 RepID=A0AAE3HH58_9FIRM|nr:hypothetical protein [Irregularibacter muris]MCR1898478.1 hypothetical protein [Irregularibacter muris]
MKKEDRYDPTLFGDKFRNQVLSRSFLQFGLNKYYKLNEEDIEFLNQIFKDNFKETSI